MSQGWIAKGFQNHDNDGETYISSLVMARTFRSRALGTRRSWSHRHGDAWVREYGARDARTFPEAEQLRREHRPPPSEADDIQGAHILPPSEAEALAEGQSAAGAVGQTQGRGPLGPPAEKGRRRLLLQ